MKKMSKVVMKKSLAVVIPVTAIGVCVLMGIRSNKPVQSVQTKDVVITDATTTMHITYTSLNNFINTTTSTTELTNTTSTIKSIYENNNTPNIVSISNTVTNTDNTECVDDYSSWDMYGNNMPVIDDYGNICEYKYVDSDLLSYIFKECQTYNVPYEFALATCFVESVFTEDINNEGLNADGSVDYGFMGLNGDYLMENCIAYNGGMPINPYNAYENVHIGIQILSSNLTYFGGSIWDAANSYNLGIGGWESMNYSCGYWYYGEKILNYIDVLSNMTNNSTNYLNEDWSVD